MTCGHAGDDHEWGSCNVCSCYVYDPYPALVVVEGGLMAGQGTTSEGFVTIVGGERADTQSGKERYVVHSNDGREFSIWDRNVYDAVNAHLHEQLKATIFTKQDDRGRWWNTLSGLPDLGIAAARVSRDGNAQNPNAGAAGLDLGPLTVILDRIATALENMVTFQVERELTAPSGDVWSEEQNAPYLPDEEGPPQ